MSYTDIVLLFLAPISFLFCTVLYRYVEYKCWYYFVRTPEYNRRVKELKAKWKDE